MGLDFTPYKEYSLGFLYFMYAINPTSINAGTRIAATKNS